MLKVLTIGDPHFKINNVPETEEMCKSIIEHCINILPDIVVVMGDVLDRHELIHSNPLNRALNFIHEVSKISPTYILVGNHDFENNTTFLTESHSLNGFKYIPKVTVIDNPMVVTVNSYNFVMCPYVYPGRLFEALEKIKIPENVSAYFLHQELCGVKIGISKSVVGDVWPEKSPLAICGHIHDYQRPQENIIYIGTPIQHGFGDDPNKTISLFTFGEGITTFPIETRLELKTTKKIVVHLTPEQLNTYQPQPGKLIKVIVTGSASEVKVYTRSEKVRELRSLGVKVIFKVNDTTVTNTQISLPVSSGHNFLTILQGIVRNSDEKRSILEMLLKEIS